MLKFTGLFHDFAYFADDSSRVPKSKVKASDTLPSSEELEEVNEEKAKLEAAAAKVAAKAVVKAVAAAKLAEEAEEKSEEEEESEEEEVAVDDDENDDDEDKDTVEAGYAKSVQTFHYLKDHVKVFIATHFKNAGKGGVSGGV